MFWYRRMCLTKMLKIVLGYDLLSEVGEIRAYLYNCIRFLGHVYKTIWSEAFKIILGTCAYNWIRALGLEVITALQRMLGMKINCIIVKVSQLGFSGPQSMIPGFTVYTNPLPGIGINWLDPMTKKNNLYHVFC